MAAFLLDTNVLIGLRDGDPEMTARVAALDGAILMSIISRVELEGGVHRDPSQAGLRRPRLDARGNSVRGIRVCQDLSQEFGMHMFDAVLTRTGGFSPRERSPVSQPGPDPLANSIPDQTRTTAPQRGMINRLDAGKANSHNGTH